MSMDSYLEKALMKLAARWVGRCFHAAPSKAQWRQCRLVAHRGDQERGRLMENSLAAFDRSLAAGVWGIELDLRWTRDHHPVVAHDRDLRRLFQSSEAIADMDLARLRRCYPRIPTLSQVIARYGGRLHLMLEIKPASHVPWERKGWILGQLLQSLSPGKDYHILALDLPSLAALGHLPSRTKLPIAQFNIPAFSREALARNYGGLCGHYLLISRRRAARHGCQAQGVGLGFVDSWPVLRWVAARGATWIFSNRAAELEGLRRTLLAAL